MTFKEKIDKILEANELKINSVSGLEDKIQAGRGAINDFYNKDREPGRKTLKKIKSLEGLNLEWYETGKGDVFIKNSTQATNNDEAAVNKFMPVSHKIKDPDEEEVRILLRNIDRIGRTNEYLLGRVMELEQLLKGHGGLPSV